VSEEIPSCGFRDLYESAGEKTGKKVGIGRAGCWRILGVAKEGELVQTASLKRLNKERNAGMHSVTFSLHGFLNSIALETKCSVSARRRNF
jgi:hypothetical protein